MNNRISVMAGLVLLACAAGLYADSIPGGDVSGTWYAVNSPYYITGSITIPASDTLTIEPGVEVEFQNLYYLAVNGYLQAVGTETDSIHFYPASTSNPWQGIRFENAPDSSHLDYCTISHAGLGMGTSPGGIICTNSNPVITHCRISDNKASGEQSTYAGGIALINSNARVSWCDISHNRSGYYGGGINISNSSPVITGCNISGNMTSRRGGGIYIAGSSNPILTGCTLEYDTSNMYGGGISVAGGVITISECTIGYNKAYDGGGGIAIFGGSVSIGHCTFEQSYCWTSYGHGGGVFANGGTLTMDHCTLFADYVMMYQYGMEIYTGGSAAMTVANSIIYSSDYYLVCFESSTPPSVSYNDFYLPPYQPQAYFYGNVPSGLGELTQVNYNGDSCDVYYNIFLDPLFVDSWDHHLTENSPCIDAGDPAFSYDPDSTITDMGAYWYDQRAPAIALSDSALDFGPVYVGEPESLGLKIFNQGAANLKISGLANSLVAFTTDYDPADSLISPGDSLALTVIFTPSDSISYCDTLNIANNDQSRAVVLNGLGQPTGVAGRPEPRPQKFAMRRAYPNPVKSGVTFAFDLPSKNWVELKVYNILGAEAATVVSKEMNAGCHRCSWKRGCLPGGVYFYRLTAGRYSATGKLVMLK